MLCEGVKSIIPADSRLSGEAARKLNGKEQKETIEFQNRLRELEMQREIDLMAARRESMNLYADDEMIER